MTIFTELIVAVQLVLGLWWVSVYQVNYNYYIIIAENVNFIDKCIYNCLKTDAEEVICLRIGTLGNDFFTNVD